MTVQGGERLGAADIVVVGAGIMGASIAFQLTRLSCCSERRGHNRI